MYTIEFLATKFAEHAIIAAKNKADLIRQFKKDYPKEPLPDYMEEDFDFPAALSCICMEIIRLRDEMKKNSDG